MADHVERYGLWDVTGRPRGFHELVGTLAWERMLASGVRRVCQRDQFVLRQGDPGGYVLLVESGRVKVMVSDGGGAELLVSVRGRGDLLGELALTEAHRRTASVVALETCHLVAIPTPQLHRLLAEQRVPTALQDYVTAKLVETVPFSIQLAHFTACQRLARLVLQLIALAESDDPNRFVVPLTHEELAEALGMVRSTVSEQISVLRQAGALGPGRRVVVSDSAILAAHAGVAVL
ncbi:Crp/Fnr family transcriptional regulator [Kutzneria buriramensis]|uniref:Crp/Fnr family transcriptional regulator n=1 Tax=Kutzneria buriramensis TaxID=1045776 RepID=UPI001477036F|nr:Crp/Fnr family transcriptional regulator [Kutzneria buriramensis]